VDQLPMTASGRIKRVDLKEKCGPLMRETLSCEEKRRPEGSNPGATDGGPGVVGKGDRG
jgi:hypothetical protein